MRLRELILENFRGYSEPTKINFENDLTAFIGKNDAGKSTILEALEIFFNNETIKIDAGDLSKNASNSVISISCVFDELPTEVIVDEEATTSLESEYLTDSNGRIHICKEYKVQATIGKPNICLVANHPSAKSLAELHSKKISELKTLGREFGVEDAVKDQRVSSQWRKALWASQKSLDLALTKISINDLGSESKAIYSKIEALLPTFALFRSDRESSDLDPEAKNPLQTAVKQAQKELSSEIEALQKKVESYVFSVADRTLEKIREMDPLLASELTPRFKEPPKWTFNFTLDGDDGIPINKRGSGARRLILLNFFRAEAEKKRVEGESQKVIYAIEEPETSQHPNYQMMLISSLLKLAGHKDCQIILTTHVPGLASLLPTDSIRLISKDLMGKPVLQYSSDEALELAVATLGVLPETGIAGANSILLVEGHSDITFINHAALTLKTAGHIATTLADKKIAIIPIGGCGNLKHWVTKQVIEQLGLNWGAFLDSDIGDVEEHAKRTKQANELGVLGKEVILTRKREAENYICPTMLSNTFGVQVQFSDTCDAKKTIGLATRTAANDVLEKYWPHRTAEAMINNSKYFEDNEEKVEIIEIINKILNIH